MEKQWRSNQDPSSKENKEILEWKKFVEEVQEAVGYKFKNLRLLYQAFTHTSFHREDKCESYERLEYVGDSVLNLLIAKEHYFLYPDLSPGQLTRLRAANVDTEKLARVAVKYDLQKYLRHNKPLLKGQVEEFKDAMLEYPLHSSGLIDPPKVLADVVESLIGAIYIDCNFSMDTTWQVVEGLLQPMITLENLETHSVTKFYEICQKMGWSVELIDTWERTGEIEFLVAGKFAGKEKFSGKKLVALNRAAHNAYCEIVKNLDVKTTYNNDSQVGYKKETKPDKIDTGLCHMIGLFTTVDNAGIILTNLLDNVIDKMYSS